MGAAKREKRNRGKGAGRKLTVTLTLLEKITPFQEAAAAGDTSVNSFTAPAQHTLFSTVILVGVQGLLERVLEVHGKVVLKGGWVYFAESSSPGSLPVKLAL